MVFGGGGGLAVAECRSEVNWGRLVGTLTEGGERNYIVSLTGVLTGVLSGVLTGVLAWILARLSLPVVVGLGELFVAVGIDWVELEQVWEREEFADGRRH